MKLHEMDTRQKKAYRNIYCAAQFHIGGLENTMADNDENSDEYRSALSDLADHAGLVETIYHEAITSIYDEGAVFFGKSAESHLRDIRFCGKQWLMERVEKRVTKCGY